MNNKKEFEKMMNKRWPTWNNGGKYWSPTQIVMLERAFLDGIEIEQKRHLTNDIHSDSEGNAILEDTVYNIEYVEENKIIVTRCR